MVRQIFEGLGGGKYGKLGEEGQRFEAHIWRAENMGWGRNLKELDRALEGVEGVEAGSFEVWVSRKHGALVQKWHREEEEEIGQNCIEVLVSWNVYGEVLN